MSTRIGPLAEVRRHPDRPSLHIDGKPVPLMAWMHWLGRFDPESLGRDEYLKALWQAGIRVYFLGASVYEEHWQDTLATVGKLLTSCPRAWIVFRVEQNLMPDEWLAAHPYDLFRLSDGTCEIRHGDFMDWASKHPEEGWFNEREREPFFRRGYHCHWLGEDVGIRRVGSYASDAWREALAAGLRGFIARVQASAFAERVIGYFPAVGCWEWFNPAATVDYSPAMRMAFQRWVEARYAGDVGQLRRAWNDSEITFEAVSQPAPDDVFACDTGNFRSPAGQRRVVDYFHCHNEAVADTVTRLAECIKTATCRSKLAGFSYGYYMSTHYALMGHSALRKVLACDDVDFIESPAPYEGRPVGNDHALPTVVESLKRAGKLFWYEADIRTHLYQEKMSGVNYGSPQTESGTLAILVREFAQYLTTGIQAYWFDQRARYYDDPAILKLFTRLQRIGELAQERPLGRKSDVACFIDEDSFFPVAQEISVNLLQRQRIQEMGRAGTPYDVWLLEDIAREDLPDYRMCVFPNAFSLDRAERELIRTRLCRDGRCIVWQYAPGFIDPGAQAFDTRNVTELTGIDCECLHSRKHLELMLTGEPGWLAASLPPHFTFGDFRDVITTGDGIDLAGRQVVEPPACMGDPVFVMTDPDATVAAYYTWDRLPGMAVKEMDGWTSVYACCLSLPHELLANVCNRAGAHLYGQPGDVVYANEQFLAVHARGTGPRTIRLRQACDVVDALSGETVVRDACEFVTDMPDLSSSLFFLGSASEWPADLCRPWR